MSEKNEIQSLIKRLELSERGRCLSPFLQVRQEDLGIVLELLKAKDKSPACCGKVRKALEITVKWMDWWLKQSDCGCEGMGHSCGYSERYVELMEAKKALSLPSSCECGKLKEEIKEVKNQCEREDELKRIALKDKYELIEKIEDLKKTLNERNSIPEWKKVQSLEAECARLRELLKDCDAFLRYLEKFQIQLSLIKRIEEALTRQDKKEGEK